MFQPRSANRILIELKIRCGYREMILELLALVKTMIEKLGASCSILPKSLIRIAIDKWVYMIVDPTNLKPRRFRSLLKASEL